MDAHDLGIDDLPAFPIPSVLADPHGIGTTWFAAFLLRLGICSRVKTDELPPGMGFFAGAWTGVVHKTTFAFFKGLDERVVILSIAQGQDDFDVVQNALADVSDVAEDLGLDLVLHMACSAGMPGVDFGLPRASRRSDYVNYSAEAVDRLMAANAERVALARQRVRQLYMNAGFRVWAHPGWGSDGHAMISEHTVRRDRRVANSEIWPSHARLGTLKSLPESVPSTDGFVEGTVYRAIPGTVLCIRGGRPVTVHGVSASGSPPDVEATSWSISELDVPLMGDPTVHVVNESPWRDNIRTALDIACRVPGAPKPVVGIPRRFFDLVPPTGFIVPTEKDDSYVDLWARVLILSDALAEYKLVDPRVTLRATSDFAKGEALPIPVFQVIYGVGGSPVVVDIENAETVAAMARLRRRAVPVRLRLISLLGAAYGLPRGPKIEDDLVVRDITLGIRVVLKLRERGHLVLTPCAPDGMLVSQARRDIQPTEWLADRSAFWTAQMNLWRKP